MKETRANVKWACDPLLERLEQIQTDYPSLAVTSDHIKAIVDPDVDAIVLATPAETHAQLAKLGLENGKHVFVEKPMATSLVEALEVADLIARKGRVFQVGHIFEYAEPVSLLRDWIERGRLGKILYITANRASHGPRLRTDVNIVWDYAIHDLYMLMYILNEQPRSVAARGSCRFYPNIEDTVFIDLYFESGTWAVLHSSWVAPTKRRDVSLIGEHAMAVYDETQENSIILYNRGYAPHEGFDSWGNLNWRLFDNGFEIPTLGGIPPLTAELSHFFDCVENGSRPVSDAEDGIRTIRVLESLNNSIKSNGKKVLVR